MQRLSIVACLVFSGFTALVYQLIWTRLLGFSFGTSTQAVSPVLAVFFGGLAIGNLLAARLQARIRRPVGQMPPVELLQQIELFALVI